MAATPEEQALVAEGFNDQKRQDKVKQDEEKPAASPLAAVAKGGGGQLFTAQLLQWAWRLYIPSFTLTSIYIVFHILCRYVFQFKVFCPAHEGSPLAISKAASVPGVKLPGSGGVSEGLWIVLSIASILPLALVLIILFSIRDAMEHPSRYIGCSIQAGLSFLGNGFSKSAFASKFLSCLLSQ